MELYPIWLDPSNIALSSPTVPSRSSSRTWRCPTVLLVLRSASTPTRLEDLRRIVEHSEPLPVRSTPSLICLSPRHPLPPHHPLPHHRHITIATATSDIDFPFVLKVAQGGTLNAQYTQTAHSGFSAPATMTSTSARPTATANTTQSAAPAAFTRPSSASTTTLSLAGLVVVVLGTFTLV